MPETVALNVEIQEGIGEAHSDDARLRNMLINLLSNAVKFTDRGEVKISASRSAAGGPTAEKDHLIFSVSDTGKGIPEEEIVTIFDEYRQVKGQSESAVQRGTGLGLSITRKFAELLGGSIRVDSEVGVGSTFTLRVPATYSGEGGNT